MSLLSLAALTELVKKWHDPLEVAVSLAFLSIGVVFHYLYFSLPPAKRPEQKLLMRIGTGFLLLGVAAIINLGILPLFQHVYAYLLHDWLELWAAIYICYGITDSLTLLAFSGAWALIIQFFLNMLPLIFIFNWQNAPFPLGGGDYPYEALVEMIGEFPIFALAAILFFGSYLRNKTPGRLFIFLGLVSLALVRVSAFAKGFPGLPKHNFLWASGHIFKVVASAMFFISFYFIFNKIKKRPGRENTGSKTP